MTYTPGKEPLATDKKQGSEDLLALLAKHTKTFEAQL